MSKAIFQLTECTDVAARGQLVDEQTVLTTRYPTTFELGQQPQPEEQLAAEGFQPAK